MRPGEKASRTKTQTAKEAGSTRLNETDLQVLRRMSLAAGDALIDQDFDFDTAILSSSALGFVGRRCSVFAHRSRRNDMPHGHTPCCIKKAITAFARSSLSFVFIAALPVESAYPVTLTMYPLRLVAVCAICWRVCWSPASSVALPTLNFKVAWPFTS